MIQKEHDRSAHFTFADEAACQYCTSLVPSNVPPRYMVVQLRFDRESFDVLKELLEDNSRNPGNSSESVGHRVKREALKRFFDQIRDVSYSNGT